MVLLLAFLSPLLIIVRSAALAPSFHSVASKSEARACGRLRITALNAVKEATFGMGCFWEPAESLVKRPGILATTVGYTGCKSPNKPPPSYDTVCFGNDYVEAVQVVYDNDILTYKQLLDYFFEFQKPGVKRQYASVIFVDEESKEEAKMANEWKDEAVVTKVKRKDNLPYEFVQIEPLTRFYKAEEYHQRYWEKQRLRAFIGIILIAGASGAYDEMFDGALKSVSFIGLQFDTLCNAVFLVGAGWMLLGYFVAILVTKILAGLPMIFLRFGALSRLLFLKTLAREHMLTQRELDAVYGLENIQYGWEYPAMLLVVVIVFTYAVICPVILPVGLVYFMGALVVYKKQILYVYSPVYESGGAMFPQAVQRTMFGLVCGQMLLLGYISTRGCYYQPVFLLPLPVITMYAMAHFNKTYAEPSSRLSLERAREYDIVSAIQEENNGVPVLKHKRPRSDAGIEARRRKFDRCAYRQPVLTEVAAEPWTYRRGVVDTETLAARERLRAVNRYMTRMNTGDYRGENGIVSPL